MTSSSSSSSNATFSMDIPHVTQLQDELRTSKEELIRVNEEMRKMQARKEELEQRIKSIKSELILNENESESVTSQYEHEQTNNILKDSEEKLRVQLLEASRRENILVMRLTSKDQDLQDYAAQLTELKSAIAPNAGTLRSTLLDPAVNIIIQKMRKELEETKKKLEDTQNDMIAWKFTPDSNTGKRLMAKCRLLYQENEDFGKMISSGKLARLESDLALHKSLTEEMKKSQSEMDELVAELDEDVEGMQSTILYLQGQLRESISSQEVTQVTMDKVDKCENNVIENDEQEFRTTYIS